MQHDVCKSEFLRPNQPPLEPLQSLRSGGGVAKPTGLLDRLRRGVVLAREAKHCARHSEPRGLRGCRHRVAFRPTGVMRVATGNLHYVDPQFLQEALEFGHASHLKRPTTDSDRQWFNCHDKALRDEEKWGDCNPAAPCRRGSCRDSVELVPTKSKKPVGICVAHSSFSRHPDVTIMQSQLLRKKCTKLKKPEPKS